MVFYPAENDKSDRIYFINCSDCGETFQVIQRPTYYIEFGEKEYCSRIWPIGMGESYAKFMKLDRYDVNQIPEDVEMKCKKCHDKQYGNWYEHTQCQTRKEDIDISKELEQLALYLKEP